MADSKMTGTPIEEEASLFPKTAGERLREAREAMGLSLAEVAARTRVPTRHLEAIERSDYSGLPSPTYSVGFAKAYACAIGLDEVVIGRDVRGQSDEIQRPLQYQPYETHDPKRQPPRGLVMATMAIAVLLLIGIGIWYGTDWFRAQPSAAATAPAAEIPPAAVEPQPASTPFAGGQVSLTATDTLWLRIYDAGRNTLFEKELQPGERYDVPAGADHPMINTGRPDALDVRVNGSLVPPLGDGRVSIKDVEISAAALLARGGDAATGASGAQSAAPASPSAAAAAPASAPPAARPTARPTDAARPRPTVQRATLPPPVVVPRSAPSTAPTSSPATPAPGPTAATPSPAATSLPTP